MKIASGIANYTVEMQARSFLVRIFFTGGSDDRGKLVQPTDRHDIISGSWTDKGSLMSNDALVRDLDSAGDSMDGSGRWI